MRGKKSRNTGRLAPLRYFGKPKVGAVDVFRFVQGLELKTASGETFFGLSDEDMLRCQYAIDEGLRRRERIATLERAIQERGSHGT